MIMEEKGWRGLIYDAPWARFKSGQTGVMISEDGKECETLSDDIHSIELDFDINMYFENREGHVLFRQKGSDLFDIVCITQEPGGTYSVEAEGGEIDGCPGTLNDKWTKFINAISIYEVINGERRQITDFNKKQNAIVHPTKSEVRDNYGGLVNTGDTEMTIPVTAVASYNGEGIIEETAETTVTVKKQGERVETFLNEAVWDFSSVELRIEEGQGGQPTVCPIILSKDRSTGIGCGGGEVQFELYISQSTCDIVKLSDEQTPENKCSKDKFKVIFSVSETTVNKNYVIYGLSKIKVKHLYSVKEGCDTEPHEEEMPGAVMARSWILEEQEGVTMTWQDDDTITFTAQPYVETVMLKVVSNMGVYGEHVISLNNLTRTTQNT